MRRIAIVLSLPPEPEFQGWVNALLRTLAQSGWTVGKNIQVDTRWARGNVAEIRRHAEVVGPLLQATRTVPIVFPIASDPVGAGFVESLARPGGNATGSLSTEFSMAAKWVELLKEIAPSVTRVAVLRDANQGGGHSQFAAVQTAGPSLRVEVSPINTGDAGQIERGVTALARSSGGGLILTGGGNSARHGDLVVALATRHKLPAVYYERMFVANGGLVSYGSDFIDHYRLAAGYVDRILKGEKPADLPVQAPTKYRLVINLKTAKTLGLDVPPSLLARADEVIEQQKTVAAFGLMKARPCRTMPATAKDHAVNFVDTKRLTNEGAKKMMATALAGAKKEGIAVSIAIVDAGGHLILLERMDGGRFHTVHSSTTKAVAAASNKRPTSPKGAVGQDLDVVNAIGLTLAAGPERWTATRGGCPILVNGECVGGIGVAGGDWNADLKIAQDAVESIGATWDPDKK